MSGGAFDYLQRRFYEIYEPIENLIENNNRLYSFEEIKELYPWVSKEEYEKYYKVLYNYPDEIISAFKEAVIAVKRAQIYAERVDYLLSDDDGEESFLIRLKEDLGKLDLDNNNNNNNNNNK
jgi:hypothetical protein